MHGIASLREIVAHLDAVLDVASYAEGEPDANGLLLDSGNDGVSQIAVAVNTSLTTIVGAAKAGAQLLIVHHTAWPGIDLHLRDEKFEALRAAGVSLYGAHASLDCAPEFGNAWVLARLLGIDVERTFMRFVAGDAGVIGACAGTFGELIRRASQALGVEVEAHEHAKGFGRVAVVTGAGGNTTDLNEARELGCDTYVTGEGSMYTRMFARETGMNLIFGTHQATEAPGIRALGERVAEYARVPWAFIAESPDVF